MEMVNFKASTSSAQVPVQTPTNYRSPIPTFLVALQKQPLLFGLMTLFHRFFFNDIIVF